MDKNFDRARMFGVRIYSRSLQYPIMQFTRDAGPLNLALSTTFNMGVTQFFYERK